MKTVYFILTFDCVDHNKPWKILIEMGIQTTWPASCMQVKGQRLELDREQWAGSKSGKEQVKARFCHPYLTPTQSTSCGIPGWMNHKLEPRLPGEISATSGMQMIPSYGRKQRGTKEPLDEGERGEWKKEYHGTWSDHFMANEEMKLRR